MKQHTKTVFHLFPTLFVTNVFLPEVYITTKSLAWFGNTKPKQEVLLVADNVSLIGDVRIADREAQSFSVLEGRECLVQSKLVLTTKAISLVCTNRTRWSDVLIRLWEVIMGLLKCVLASWTLHKIISLQKYFVVCTRYNSNHFVNSSMNDCMHDSRQYQFAMR